MTALDDLSDQFWTWRTVNQPNSYDDVTRVARPAGWTSDWSKVAIEGRRERLRGFTDEFAAVDLADQPVGVQVDGRLLGSALARAYWELELLGSWESDPRFYIDQSQEPLYRAVPRRHGRAVGGGDDSAGAVLTRRGGARAARADARSRPAGAGHPAASATRRPGRAGRCPAGGRGCRPPVLRRTRPAQPARRSATLPFRRHAALPFTLDATGGAALRGQH